MNEENRLRALKVPKMIQDENGIYRGLKISVFPDLKSQIYEGAYGMESGYEQPQRVYQYNDL